MGKIWAESLGRVGGQVVGFVFSAQSLQLLLNNFTYFTRIAVNFSFYMTILFVLMWKM